MNLSAIRIVLTRPLYGGNVGSVCRAMMNMGLSDLAVVKPTLRLRPAEVRKMALGAIGIYDRRGRFDTLAEAVADCHVVAGTSSRRGLYRAHACTPREIAPSLIADSDAGRVALVFGPEDDGLTNDEIALCTRIIEIPSDDAYRSLNLSQAVMVCAYELYAGSGLYQPVEEPSPEAPHSQREKMLAMWEEAMLNIGFLDEVNRAHMMHGIRRIFSRGRLMENDVRILMGIASQASWVADELRKFRDFS